MKKKNKKLLSIDEADLNINKGEVHKMLLDNCSINSGAHKNKKKEIHRKRKHKGKDE